MPNYPTDKRRIVGRPRRPRRLRYEPLEPRTLLAVSPLAVDDSYTVPEDVLLEHDAATGLLANDDLRDQASVAVQLVVGPEHGTLSLTADGAFDYTPEADFFGEDGFDYRIDAAGTLPASVSPATTLTAADAAPDARFGFSTAVAGDWLFVGAASDSGQANQAGAVYVFAQTGGVWAPSAKLTAPDAAADALFGTAVATDGQVLLVGAPGAGTAYAFELAASIWEYRQTVTSPAVADRFGQAVALDGDATAVVGAPGDAGAGADSGAAYVFARQSGQWQSQARLLPDDPGAGNLFGRAVAIDAGLVAAGAPGHDGEGADSGAVYLFAQDPDGWNRTAKLTAADTEASDEFGRAVYVAGDRLVVGAPGDGGTGAAYVFDNDGLAWNEQQKLTGDETLTGDRFGEAIAGDGGIVVVAAPDADAGAVDAGAAYLFQPGGATLVQQAKLAGAAPVDGDRFGAAVGIAGDWVVAGVPRDDDSGGDAGSVATTQVTWENTAHVTIAVDSVNDAPVALDETYDVAQDGRLQVVASVPILDPPVGFSLTDFSDVSTLTLNGDATEATDNVDGHAVLRLTDSPATNQAGSAFTTTPVHFAHDFSFGTDFAYRLSDPDANTQGGEGFTFVIHDDPAGASVLGGSGGDMGLFGGGGTASGLALVFDTFNTFTTYDNVTLWADGRAIERVWLGDALNDGQVRYAWVDYDAATYALEVRLSSTAARPATASLSKFLDLRDVFATRDLYVGFTASTGSGTNDHDIRRWSLTSDSTLPEVVDPVELVPADVVWKFSDTGTDLGTAWRGSGYDDSAWNFGPAELGYGDGDEATEIGFGPDAGDKQPTSYFRHTFQVQGVHEIDEAFVHLLRDDGAAVYLNGVEVVRSNLGVGATYSTYTGNNALADGNAFHFAPVDASLLVEGENVLAVEVHQTSPTSSDLSFALKLAARRVVGDSVLANDVDVEDDALSARPVLGGDPAHGSLTLGADGGFIYTPDAGYSGSDTFAYEADDGTAATAATVTIRVHPTGNLAPATAADFYPIDEDAVLSVGAGAGVLANDSDAADPIADVLEATLAAPPAHGLLTLHGDGSFDYTPDADYHGIDQFTYVAGDGYLASAPTPVTIVVLPLPDDPAAADDSYTVQVDRTLTTTAATLGEKVADSVADFSGVQGQNGWFYGYYDAGGDVDGTYQAGEFTPFAADEWTGSRWRPTDRPPNTALAQVWSLPNGSNRTGGEQWAIRRWQSDVEGTVAIDWRLAKYLYTGGNGVSGLVFVNGQLVDQTTIARNDLAGVSRRVAIDVSVGDVVDFAHSPVGTDGNATDGGDYATMSAVIQLGDFTERTLVPAGATWKYRADGLNLGAAWRDAGYDDGTWPAGAAKLGYGEDDEATVISYGFDPDDKFVTYYFRHSFDLGATRAAEVAQLRVKAKIDDGMAVYLNGEEIVRDLLAPDADFDDFAGNAPTDGKAFVWFDVDRSSLVDGTNVLAVEVHQTTATSSDVSFDLELVAAVGPPGVLANDVDADGDTLEAVATSQPDHGTVALDADGTFQYMPDAGYSGPDQFAYTALSEPIALVAAAAAARTSIPADAALGTTWTGGVPFDDSAWTAGPTGVGFNGTQAGFTVTNHFANVSVDSLAAAESVVADPGLRLSTATEVVAVVDYLEGSSTGHYTVDADFPGIAPGSSPNDYVVEATATVSIPTAGVWTFGVRSDDGFGLDVGSFHSEFPSPRGQADTLATFDFAVAGDYPLRLMMFDTASDGMVELFAAAGTHVAFDAGAFRLVGDVGGGGLTVFTTGTAIDAASIGTDVATEMEGVNATAYVRVPLVVADPGDLAALVLDMQYDDGFVAYLNGVEIARRHAPVSLAWNSAAEDVGDGDVRRERIDVSDHLGDLAVGTNILAVHGLNASAGDDDFLVLPQLTGYRRADSATVQITVNAAPQADDDAYQTPEDQPLSIDAVGGLLANDTDESGVPLEAAVLVGPTHGRLTLAADGSFTYEPDADYFGLDGFTYRAGDGHLWSDPATVTIDVLPRNDAPVAVDDYYQTVFNVPIVAGGGAGTGSEAVFFTDFESGVPTEFSGYFTAESVQGFAGIGNGGNTFSGTMLRNDSGPRTQLPTRLLLTDLPVHESIDLNFLLAVIDSWNGAGGSGAPDYLTILVDGTAVFTQAFDVFDLNDGYAAPPGGLLGSDVDLGFSTWVDAAFDLGPEAALSAIPHTAADVLIEWAAWGSFSSWTGGTDESWAIDNVEVVLNNVGGARITDTLITLGADWKYLDDGSNQGVVWRDAGFDDASWGEGPAQLGYGDGDEATEVGFGGDENDKFATTYFRRAFSVGDAAAYSALYLRLVRDDAAAVYVNGTEVLRTDNLAPNAGFDMYADFGGSFAVGGLDEHRFEYFQLDPAVLVDGENIVAVEIHQHEPDSSDISFDLGLSAARGTSIGVLANDVEVDGEAIGAFLMNGPEDGPSHGQLTFQGDGGFAYTPEVDYIGPDSFRYTAFAVTSLVAPGAGARLLVPTGEIGGDWTGGAEPFDDSGWIDVATGIGFGEVPGDPPTPLLFAGGTDVQTHLLGQNSSAYLRVPFELDDSSAVDILALYMQYDDGFVAYLNGNEVVARNEPDVPAYDAAATTERTGADRLQFEEFIVPITAGLLQSGTNVLAVHGLNFTPNDPDFVISPALAFAQLSNPATVSIDVIYVNTPAVTHPDAYVVDEDMLLEVTTSGTLGDGVLANDTDVDDDPLQAVLADDVQHGTLTLAADGTFTYQADADYYGPDGFTYRAFDGIDPSNVASVSITVDPINDPPVAGDDAYVVETGVELSVGAVAGLLANDVDVDGPAVSAVLLSGPASGLLDLQSDGSFTYDPQGTPVGAVTFTYRADDTLDNSNMATVTLLVDTSPVAVDDLDYMVLEDQTLVIEAAAGVLANDFDAESDTLGAVLVDDVKHGTLALAADGSFTFTPAAEYSGNDSFTYRADDGDQRSAVATVTIAVTSVNDPPLAVDDTYFIEQGGTLMVDPAGGILANDVDPDDLVLTVWQHGPVSAGTLALGRDCHAAGAS